MPALWAFIHIINSAVNASPVRGRCETLPSSVGNARLIRAACACPGDEGTRNCNFGRLCGVLSIGGLDAGQILMGLPSICVRRDELPAAAADQISLRCLAIFLNGSLSVFALRRTAKVVRFRGSAMVSTLFALRTSARSFLSCSGVQGARGVPFISPSPFVPPELQPASSRIRLAYRLAVDRRDYSSHTTSAFHPVPVYRYCSL